MPCPPFPRPLAAALLVAVVAASPAAAFKRTFKGEALKDFDLPALSGESLRLSERLGEKATVVIFWASWSPRSAEALGEFQEMYAEHSAGGLQVVAVNVEHTELAPEQRASLETLVTTKGLGYPVLLDEGLVVFDRYGVIAVPSLLLVDPGGTVLDLLEGYSNMTRCDFRDRVLEILGVLSREEEPPAGEASAYCPVGKAARYYQMGELFLRKKMARRAVKALRRAVKEDPNYVEAYVRLAEALGLQGEDEAAGEARQRAEALGMAPPPPFAKGDPAGGAAVDSPGPGQVEEMDPQAAPPGGNPSLPAATSSPARDSGGPKEDKP